MPHLGGLACDLLHNDVPRFHCYDMKCRADLILHATIQNDYLWDQTTGPSAMRSSSESGEGLQIVITRLLGHHEAFQDQGSLHSVK